METHILVWIDEEEKWYHFKEDFDESQFENGYVSYEIEIDSLGVIVKDDFNRDNKGKIFTECYKSILK